MRVAHSPRTRDDVTSTSERGYPRRLVDALATEVPGDLRRIGRVKSDPQLRCEALARPMLGEPALDCDRRGHGEFRGIEADEEAVACRRDLLAGMGRENLSERRVVPAQDRVPGLVAERLDEARRTDDVGEHERLHNPARGPGLAAQLPGQELCNVLEDDGRRRTGERRGPQDILVDAVGADDVCLAVVASEPVEGRRGETDAVARAYALVAIDARPEGHQPEPTVARPRNASEVASARLEAPSRANRRVSRAATSSSVQSISAAISAFVRPSVRSCRSRRSMSSTVAGRSTSVSAPGSGSASMVRSIGPASSTTSRPTGPVSHATRIFSSVVPWAIRESTSWR